ncbi:MAG: transglycosylase domain-containing protein, partial [Bacteroidota bacterium]
MAKQKKNNQSENKKKEKPSFKKTIRTLWVIYFAGLFAVILIFFMISRGWLGFMPSFEELENPKSNLASEIYSADDILLGKYFFENRSNVPYRALPENLIYALLATEDIRFRKHSGVDIKGTIAGVVSTIRGKQRGASTITQQLAKNLFFTPERSWERKIKEVLLAIKIENNLGKKEILERYLNLIYLGNRAYGVKAAASVYFGKDISDTGADGLTRAEAAMLAALARAPSYYNP